MYRVFLMGDVHGKYQDIRDFYTLMNSTFGKRKKIDKTDTLIFLGDFGANYFFNYRDEDFKERLGKYEMQYFVIRGNHEERPSVCAAQNPSMWEKSSYFGNEVWVEKKYPYIKYAMDFPTIYSINHYSTLVIPGAYSVDKQYRLQNGMNWFPQEQLTEKEMNFGRKITNIIDNFDLVLSHTCPIIYEPTDLFISSIDQNLVDKTMERYLGEIECRISYKLWCWGHFHKMRIYPKYQDSDRVMLFNDYVLDLDKYKETRDPYSSLIKLHNQGEA